MFNLCMFSILTNILKIKQPAAIKAKTSLQLSSKYTTPLIC